MSDAQHENLFEITEAAAQLVATFTGTKQQFIDAGWSEMGAEAMVIEILRKGDST